MRPRYGAPLVLKRDNEGNVNHTAINDVLAESFVLPLNTPGDYAPYNGAMDGVDIEQKTITLYDTKKEETRVICFNDNPELKKVILGSLNRRMPFRCSFLSHLLLCL